MSIEADIVALRQSATGTGETPASKKELAAIVNNFSGTETIQFLRARKAAREGKISQSDFNSVFSHLVRKSRSRLTGKARSNGASGSKRGSNG